MSPKDPPAGFGVEVSSSRLSRWGIKSQAVPNSLQIATVVGFRSWLAVNDRTEPSIKRTDNRVVRFFKGLSRPVGLKLIPRLLLRSNFHRVGRRWKRAAIS
jgi:hypothetical protein